MKTVATAWAGGTPPTPLVSLACSEVPPIQPALSKLDEISQLPKNWDSYGALPPKRECLLIAKWVLYYLRNLRTDIPLPWIVPTSRGGIQMEWHFGGIDIEIDIDPDPEERGILIDDEDLPLEARWLGLIPILIPRFGSFPAHR